MSESELRLADYVRAIPLEHLPPRERMQLIRMIVSAGEVRSKVSAALSLCVGCGVDESFSCECDHCQSASAIRVYVKDARRLLTGEGES